MTGKAQPPKTAIIDKDHAIIVRSSDGSKIRRIKTRRRLSVEEGTLVKIINAKKAWKNRPAQPPVLIPTANGFMQLASGSGLCLNHPDSVVVDGKEQPNGYRDANGTYYFRAQAGGYTDLGQPFITDRTVDYNVDRYNIQDLLAKAKQDENAQYFKVLPFRGKDEHGMLLGPPKDGDWAGYQVDKATVLWVDCACPEFTRWLSEMNNREKNAIRVCQTFADRNAIAAHPALPAKKKFETTEAVVECVSWYAEQGTITFKQLLAHGDVELDTAESVSIHEDPEAARVVDVEASVVPEGAQDVETVEDKDAEIDEDDNLPMREEKAEPPPDTADLVKRIEKIAEMKSTSYHKARQTLGIDDAAALEMLGAEQLEDLYRLLQMA